DVLCAVSVVYVPVDDQDSLQLVLFDRIVGGNRDVVEETKTGGFVSTGMMARRPDAGKPVEALVLQHTVHHLEESTGRQSGHFKGVLREVYRVKCGFVFTQVFVLHRLSITNRLEQFLRMTLANLLLGDQSAVVG